MTAQEGLVRINLPERRMRDYRALFLVGFILILGLNLGLLSYLTYREQREPNVQFLSLRLTGPANLCPNEDLIYMASIRFLKPGQATIIGTVRHLHVDSNGKTVLHLHSVMNEQFQSEVAGEFTVRRYFRLPMTMVDPITGLSLPWASGKYEWQVTVYSLGGLSGQTKRVPFQIHQGCPPPF